MPDRFPKPWRAVELEESFAIEDASGFRIAYVYFHDPERPFAVNQRPTRDQARKIANAFAKVGAL